ncbi:hypothetical protein MMC21_005841 [Puttea exsequens]|nr:hypothetical protein [Puttea exsequens]
MTTTVTGSQGQAKVEVILAANCGMLYDVYENPYVPKSPINSSDYGPEFVANGVEYFNSDINNDNFGGTLPGYITQPVKDLPNQQPHQVAPGPLTTTPITTTPASPSRQTNSGNYDPIDTPPLIIYLFFHYGQKTAITECAGTAANSNYGSFALYFFNSTDSWVCIIYNYIVITYIDLTVADSDVIKTFGHTLDPPQLPTCDAPNPGFTQYLGGTSVIADGNNFANMINPSITAYL